MSKNEINTGYYYLASSTNQDVEKHFQSKMPRSLIVDEIVCLEIPLTAEFQGETIRFIAPTGFWFEIKPVDVVNCKMKGRNRETLNGITITTAKSVYQFYQK